MSIQVVEIQKGYAIRKGSWPFYAYFDLYTCDDWWEEDTPSFSYCVTPSKALANVMLEIMIERTDLMKDYVNTSKPSAMRRFWRKHADDCRFWVIIGLIILAGGVL
jgi:hypothetical protein